VLIRFFCLGPTNSRFSICALQLTDSFYVAHSEDLLYRTGYEEFKRLNGSEDFFYFIHSAGVLEKNTSTNIDKRRIYIDLDEQRVLSVNNQYAGNSIGLKKLALRLAIYKANHEDWLTEHMFIMGVKPIGKNRVSYFSGAYPSACGKTSTAMIPGQQIIGDDIAYIRADDEGYARAVNIEHGVFGIIRDVNKIDDPLIFKALTTPRELIFSNVLINDGVPYWLGDGRKPLKSGINHSGEWFEGKKDKEENEIPLAHPNARYTMRIKELENYDPALNDPNGVPIMGIFYGGRDSDTTVTIIESLNWEHGVFLGAIIESESTSATLGKVGVRKASPMANLDFMVVPLGLYLENHRKFGNRLPNCPKIFKTNYFLKKDGKYCNGMLDKKIWVLWAEGRIHNEYKALKTPIGYIPKYNDLKQLFKKVLDQEYIEKDYIYQFSIRISKLLEKYERMEKMYKEEIDIPKFFWDCLKSQKKCLLEAKKNFSMDNIPPNLF
jgi:phosphoenolpyruvate carboxykinase (GTP)